MSVLVKGLMTGLGCAIVYLLSRKRLLRSTTSSTSTTTTTATTSYATLDSLKKEQEEHIASEWDLPVTWEIYALEPDSIWAVDYCKWAGVMFKWSIEGVRDPLLRFIRFHREWLKKKYSFLIGARIIAPHHCQTESATIKCIQFGTWITVYVGTPQTFHWPPNYGVIGVRRTGIGDFDLEYSEKFQVSRKLNKRPLKVPWEIFHQWLPRVLLQIIQEYLDENESYVTNEWTDLASWLGPYNLDISQLLNVLLRTVT
jgi:hypothetical protein